MITVYQDPDGFLEKTQALLEEDEAANNLMLGVILRVKAGDYKIPPYLATVEEQGRVTLAASMTPPYRLLLTAFQPDVQGAVAEVANNLLDDGVPVPGANGRTETVRQFIPIWQQLTGKTGRRDIWLRAYILREVIPPARPPGEMRLAAREDIETIARWTEAFSAEAVPNDPPVNRREWAATRIARGDIFLWEDAQPVAMALRNRPLKHSISVSGVYTPPELRRKGYATSLVADLSQRLLDEGYQFCTLFTDLTNPTSNSIYQKIGYQPICEYEAYLFVE